MKLRETCVVIFSLTALICLAFGARAAMRSPLFTLQVVEVIDDGTVDPQKIIDLAALPVGKASLFDLDLDAVEKRILTHPWVHDVRLQKRFPQTLSIAVDYRKARALLQTQQGSLSYVDDEGRVLGKVNLQSSSDLPIVSGFPHSSGAEKIREALRLIDEWEKDIRIGETQLASVEWEKERGFRGLAVYPMNAGASRGRVMIDFGHEFDGETPAQFARLSSVLRYLSDKSIAANQIWIDSGKKIVVRTARGS